MSIYSEILIKNYFYTDNCSNYQYILSCMQLLEKFKYMKQKSFLQKSSSWDIVEFF